MCENKCFFESGSIIRDVISPPSLELLWGKRISGWILDRVSSPSETFMGIQANCLLALEWNKTHSGARKKNSTSFKTRRVSQSVCSPWSSLDCLLMRCSLEIGNCSAIGRSYSGSLILNELQRIKGISYVILVWRSFFTSKYWKSFPWFPCQDDSEFEPCTETDKHSTSSFKGIFSF